MKKYIAVLCLLAALSGCVSPESRAAYEQAKAELVSISEKFEADRIANGRENQLLKDQVLAAQANLNAAKADMAASRVDETASKVSSWLGMLGPLAGFAYPPAMAILGPLQGALAGFMASRKKVV